MDSSGVSLKTERGSRGCSPRAANGLRRRWLWCVMAVWLLWVWAMSAARSCSPPAPSIRREASPRGPHPPPRLQLWRAAVDLLAHDDDSAARVLQSRMKIGAILWTIYRAFSSIS
jgi:hypothetical protein